MRSFPYYKDPKNIRPPKDCPKCGLKRRRLPTGFPYCNICNTSASKKYVQNNRDKVIAYRKNRYESKKNEILNKQKLYYQSKKDRICARVKLYNTKVPSEKKILTGMKDRCYNPKNTNYRHYGERGITICDRWLTSFDNFLQDMGPRPSSRHSIDRIDVNGNYEPGNCRWATAKEQANNTRRQLHHKLAIPDDSPIYLEYGKLGTLKEFSEKHNLPLSIVKYRYSNHQNEDWILHADNDNRDYFYRDKKYNMVELSIISNIPYSLMYQRLIRDGMSVNKAMTLPIDRKLQTNTKLTILPNCSRCGGKRHRDKTNRIRCKPCDLADRRKLYHKNIEYGRQYNREAYYKRKSSSIN